MIIVDGKVIVESEEMDALLDFEHMIKAVSFLALEIQKPDGESACEEQEFKPLPASYRCRICGRHYVYKSEAKACERDHKRTWK